MGQKILEKSNDYIHGEQALPVVKEQRGVRPWWVSQHR